MSEERFIRLHVAAPPKPPLGMPCNGCGVCCAAEPCPPARLFLRQRHGACRALQWQAEAGCYRCGLVLEPERYFPWLRGGLRSGARRWFARSISAGFGCDSDAEVESLPTPISSAKNL